MAAALSEGAEEGGASTADEDDLELGRADEAGEEYLVADEEYEDDAPVEELPLDEGVNLKIKRLKTRKPKK